MALGDAALPVQGGTGYWVLGGTRQGCGGRADRGVAGVLVLLRCGGCEERGQVGKRVLGRASLSGSVKSEEGLGAAGAVSSAGALGRPCLHLRLRGPQGQAPPLHVSLFCCPLSLPSRDPPLLPSAFTGTYKVS